MLDVAVAHPLDYIIPIPDRHVPLKFWAKDTNDFDPSQSWRNGDLELYTDSSCFIFCVIKVVLRSTVYRYENNCLRCDSPTLKKLTTFSKTRIIGRENNLPSPIFAFVAGLRPPSLDYRKAALVYRPATQF